MGVLKPWTPVKAEKTELGYEISVEGRKYTLDGRSPMFSSIISQGEEILASPIRFVATNKGEKCIFCKADSFMMDESDEQSCSVVSTFQSKDVVINVSHTVEFDGCDDISLSIMPSGRSVNASLGLEKFDMASFDLDSLCMEIPLRKDVIKYFNVYPTGGVIFNNPEEMDKNMPNHDGFKRSGLIPPSGIHGPTQSQIYLNGDDKGIGFFIDSYKDFSIEDANRAFEIEFINGDIILRLHILDRTPDFWANKGVNNCQSRDLFPIQFRFGMQVTPIKKAGARPFTEKNLHIDCFKKTPGNYDEYLSGSVVEWDSDIGFDRIKKLGVDTLYIHEKWNDIQNSVELTRETAQRLKRIVDECHKRDIKVVPYFGYEYSTLSDHYKRFGLKHAVIEERMLHGANAMWHWYRYPYQRDLFACMNSDYLDYFYEGLVKLQQRFNFDGFYFDGTSTVKKCVNTEHGCGWRDSKGELHYTYQNFAIRKFFKKIYTYAAEKNLIINHHTNGCYALCCVGFCTSLWEGEFVQAQFLNQNIKRLPETTMRAMFSARDLGVPMYTLCYSKEGVWEYENGASIALLYGSVPKVNDIGRPLEYMSKIWQIMDAFPIEESKWISYYGGNDLVKSDNDTVKISLYKADGKILAFCTSITVDFDEEVTVTSDYRKITDAFLGNVLSNNGRCVLKFGGFECKILVIEKD